ncbi:hypothetical protein D3C76_943320 [compost metagenome]
MYPAGPGCPGHESDLQQPAPGRLGRAVAALERPGLRGLRRHRVRPPGGAGRHRTADRPVHQHPAGDQQPGPEADWQRLVAPGPGPEPGPARAGAHAPGGYTALGRQQWHGPVRYLAGVRELPGIPGSAGEGPARPGLRRADQRGAHQLSADPAGPSGPDFEDSRQLRARALHAGQHRRVAAAVGAPGRVPRLAAAAAIGPARGLASGPAPARAGGLQPHRP